MGLAVSQVRLLALTNRKADIELQLQVNSKRKQQLTRKSTELAQEYYNRLQNTSIMYATSNGYEDVDFNYVMGETVNGEYTNSFMQDVTTGFNNGTAHKPESKMVLTDAYGQVVVNDSLAKVIAKVNDDNQYVKVKDEEGNSTYQQVSVLDKTAKAMLQLIKDACDGAMVASDGSTAGTSQMYCQALNQLYEKISEPNDNGGRTINEEKYNQYLNYFTEMILRYDESSLDGGVLYCANNANPMNVTTYYLDKEGNIPAVGVPKSGYIYQVKSLGTSVGIANRVLFYGNPPVAQCDSYDSTDHVCKGGVTEGIAENMKNLVEYFAPIFSAAFKNGSSTSVSRNVENSDCTFESKFVRDGAGTLVQVIPMSNVNGTKTDIATDSKGNYTGGCVEIPSNLSTAEIVSFLSSTANTYKDALPVGASYFTVVNKDGIREYFTVIKNSEGSIGISVFDQENRSVSDEFFSSYSVEESGNKVFKNASNVDNLQAGFKSGSYQFCMVGNVSRGSYHKNTRMNYFTRQGIVSEKMDSSKREEITAWFNVEQAAISEKETYWDTEIQNLSTELNSVTTEIESVKQLKSNAIKSVFNWGGQ